MKKILLSILEDNSGGVSTMRCIALVWVAALTFVWVYTSIRGGTVAEIPTGVLSVTGIIVGGKAIQRFGEAPSTNQNNTTIL